jgi:hypothetical protein
MINVGPYELDIYDGVTGVCVSGGADSALLLYILMSNTKHHLHVYTFISPERREAIESHVDATVETCARLTGKTDYTYHKQYVDSQLPDVMLPLFKSKFANDSIGMLYLGLTKFPPKEVWKQFEQQQPEWHNGFRDDEVVHPLYGMTLPSGSESFDPSVTQVSIDERVYKPFVNLNKKDIAAMYRILSVEEQLFKVTRSCETPEHVGSHCGKCWWCDERKWAFGYLE